MCRSTCIKQRESGPMELASRSEVVLAPRMSSIVPRLDRQANAYVTIWQAGPTVPCRCQYAPRSCIRMGCFGVALPKCRPGVDRRAARNGKTKNTNPGYRTHRTHDNGHDTCLCVIIVRCPPAPTLPAHSHRSWRSTSLFFWRQRGSARAHARRA